eukprot:CAMPEP_0170523456 /NCGR_PEP_ID=MMETSP0209-20121228/8865_1 /TAXON_ID=665100 ORGANISM="Litonotus pictus, Strain P1" /NCGR_SAMPLE_ID=MMETSP0209 /ASSEMBLY_ACC=CAM_ASM_000301 /LENGTH=1878 /DNA_ID=CAMNT_0010811537 /DNA_START=777 /DNA_END=6413 /DNA_ORIENTATION=-
MNEYRASTENNVLFSEESYEEEDKESDQEEICFEGQSETDDSEDVVQSESNIQTEENKRKMTPTKLSLPEPNFTFKLSCLLILVSLLIVSIYKNQLNTFLLLFTMTLLLSTLWAKMVIEGRQIAHLESKLKAKNEVITKLKSIINSSPIISLVKSSKDSCLTKASNIEQAMGLFPSNTNLQGKLNSPEKRESFRNNNKNKFSNLNKELSDYVLSSTYNKKHNFQPNESSLIGLNNGFHNKTLADILDQNKELICTHSKKGIINMGIFTFKSGSHPEKKISSCQYQSIINCESDSSLRKYTNDMAFMTPNNNKPKNANYIDNCFDLNNGEEGVVPKLYEVYIRVVNFNSRNDLCLRLKNLTQSNETDSQNPNHPQEGFFDFVFQSKDSSKELHRNTSCFNTHHKSSFNNSYLDSVKEPRSKLNNTEIYVYLKNVSSAVNSTNKKMENKYQNIIMSKLSHEIKTPSIGTSFILNDLNEIILDLYNLCNRGKPIGNTSRCMKSTYRSYKPFKDNPDSLVEGEDDFESSCEEEKNKKNKKVSEYIKSKSRVTLGSQNHVKSLDLKNSIDKNLIKLQIINDLICNSILEMSDFVQKPYTCKVKAEEVTLSEISNWAFCCLNILLELNSKQNMIVPQIIIQEEIMEDIVSVDFSKLKIFLTEILKNAVKFTTHGRITVEFKTSTVTKKEEDTEQNLSYCNGQNYRKSVFLKTSSNNIFSRIGNPSKIKTKQNITEPNLSVKKVPGKYQEKIKNGEESQEEEEYVYIKVSDTGRGISYQFLNKILEDHQKIDYLHEKINIMNKIKRRNKRRCSNNNRNSVLNEEVKDLAVPQPISNSTKRVINHKLSGTSSPINKRHRSREESKDFNDSFYSKQSRDSELNVTRRAESSTISPYGPQRNRVHRLSKRISPFSIHNSVETLNDRESRNTEKKNDFDIDLFMRYEDELYEIEDNFAKEGKLSLGITLIKSYSVILNLELQLSSEFGKGTSYEFSLVKVKKDSYSEKENEKEQDNKRIHSRFSSKSINRFNMHTKLKDSKMAFGFNFTQTRALRKLEATNSNDLSEQISKIIHKNTVSKYHSRVNNKSLILKIDEEGQVKKANSFNLRKSTMNVNTISNSRKLSLISLDIKSSQKIYSKESLRADDIRSFSESNLLPQKKLKENLCDINYQEPRLSRLNESKDSLSSRSISSFKLDTFESNNENVNLSLKKSKEKSNTSIISGKNAISPKYLSRERRTSVRSSIEGEKINILELIKNNTIEEVERYSQSDNSSITKKVKSSSHSGSDCNKSVNSQGYNSSISSNFNNSKDHDSSSDSCENHSNAENKNSKKNSEKELSTIEYLNDIDEFSTLKENSNYNNLASNYNMLYKESIERPGRKRNSPHPFSDHQKKEVKKKPEINSRDLDRNMNTMRSKSENAVVRSNVSEKAPIMNFSGTQSNKPYDFNYFLKYLAPQESKGNKNIETRKNSKGIGNKNSTKNISKSDVLNKKEQGKTASRERNKSDDLKKDRKPEKYFFKDDKKKHSIAVSVASEKKNSLRIASSLETAKCKLNTISSNQSSFKRIMLIKENRFELVGSSMSFDNKKLFSNNREVKQTKPPSNKQFAMNDKDQISGSKNGSKNRVIQFKDTVKDFRHHKGGEFQSNSQNFPEVSSFSPHNKPIYSTKNSVYSSPDKSRRISIINNIVDIKSCRLFKKEEKDILNKKNSRLFQSTLKGPEQSSTIVTNPDTTYIFHSHILDFLPENTNIILIVDDDSLCRKSLKKLVENCISSLNKEYFGRTRVVKLGDGLDTVNMMLEDFSLNRNMIKFIISDENMAIMNGSESFSHLNKLVKMQKVNSIPKIIYTALEADNALAQIKLVSECNEIVKKPVSKKDLTSILANYLALGSNA